MVLVFGRVPHPPFIDQQHTTADKPQGRGWDNLGRRNPRAVGLHRMWGTLRGTRSHFGDPNVASLTDYGIGCESVDGASLAGVIDRYNDPRGFRSGWANGRVSAPFGDGKAFVDKYGITAVNRDVVSIETSGFESDPFDDFAWSRLVWLCAYWADQMRVPFDTLPLNPHTGFNLIIWHTEFTAGTGKTCPFRWMRNNTPRLYRDIANFLKPYQSGSTGQPPAKPEPEPIDVPNVYADPLPIAALAELADDDDDRIAAVTTTEGSDFLFVGDRVKATRATPRLQEAKPLSLLVGPDIEAGEVFDVDFVVKSAADGEWYYITPWWTRVRLDDTARVGD